MNKKEKLANIYIKIYNKCPLTMDDLTFLSKYDPECFAKTCQNLVYTIPETKKLLNRNDSEGEKLPKSLPVISEVPAGEEVFAKKENMELLLQNLKKIETKEIFVQEVKAEKVKELLGSLYMELLFPHNDREQYFAMEKDEEESKFNKKV